MPGSPLQLGGGSSTSQGTFNVLTYGAIGDGVTDDTTAINNAIVAAIAVGGTVVFPPGYTYLMSGAMVIPSTVPGSGWGFSGEARNYQGSLRLTGGSGGNATARWGNPPSPVGVGATLDLRWSGGSPRLDSVTVAANSAVVTDASTISGDVGSYVVVTAKGTSNLVTGTVLGKITAVTPSTSFTLSTALANQGAISGTCTVGIQTSAQVAKICTFGDGVLEIDHLVIKDGGTDTYPFFLGTATVVYEHDNSWLGSAALLYSICTTTGAASGVTTLTVTSTAGFPATGAVECTNNSGQCFIFAYTGLTGTTFTGVTLLYGTGANTLSSGAQLWAVPQQDCMLWGNLGTQWAPGVVEASFSGYGTKSARSAFMGFRYLHRLGDDSNGIVFEDLNIGTNCSDVAATGAPIFVLPQVRNNCLGNIVRGGTFEQTFYQYYVSLGAAANCSGWTIEAPGGYFEASGIPAGVVYLGAAAVSNIISVAAFTLNSMPAVGGPGAPPTNANIVLDPRPYVAGGAVGSMLNQFNFSTWISADVSLIASGWTTVATSPTLPVGIYLVLARGLFYNSVAGVAGADLRLQLGTAAGAFQPVYPQISVYSVATATLPVLPFSIMAVCVVTTAGTIILSGCSTQATGTQVLHTASETATGNTPSAANQQTGIVAVRLA